MRHIFDLRLQGNGFRKIALILNAEKVPAPRTFYYMAEGRENHRGETPFWNDVTVKTILRNEVYLGHMVQNKTGTVLSLIHIYRKSRDVTAFLYERLSRDDNLEGES